MGDEAHYSCGVPGKTLAMAGVAATRPGITGALLVAMSLLTLRLTILTTKCRTILQTNRVPPRCLTLWKVKA